MRQAVSREIRHCSVEVCFYSLQCVINNLYNDFVCAKLLKMIFIAIFLKKVRENLGRVWTLIDKRGTYHSNSYYATMRCRSFSVSLFLFLHFLAEINKAQPNSAQALVGVLK